MTAHRAGPYPRAMDLEVRHLRTLTTVAALGSITKAAATLGVAQPALSAQLSRIDRALGGPVFVRDHRGVRPTALGALVLDRARTLLPAMDALVQDARRVAGGDAATPTRVASTGSALAAAFAHRLAVAHRAPPTLQVVAGAAQAAAALAAGSYDALLVGMCGDALPPATPGTQWRAVGTDPTVVVVRADHPCGDVTDLAALGDERWVTPAGDGCVAACLQRACARAGLAPPSASACDRATSLDLVLAGAAVALAEPFGTLPPGVRAVALRDAPLTWSTWLALPDDAPAELRGRAAAAARAARRDMLAGGGAHGSARLVGGGPATRVAM